VSDDLARLDATAQAELVRRGRATPRELVEAAIARLERLEPRLGCLVSPLFDAARAAADAPDLPAGPLRGVPFLMKDLIGAGRGEPCFQGNRALRDAGFKSPVETYVARRLREAGLISLGRTKTPELGFNVTTEPEAHGPARNPWSLAHSTGGSSGGSAAAVAARIVPLAHGGDGGGSIRIPASACGLVGLKPSRGRVSCGPLYGELWHGLATEGMLSLSVRDAALALDCLSGPMPGDPYAAPPPARPFAEEVDREPGRLRVGVLPALPESLVHPECTRAARDAMRRLESLGHAVEEVWPAAFAEAEGVGTHLDTLLLAHLRRNVEEIGLALGRDVGPRDFERYTWHAAERGRTVSAAQYVGAMDWLHAWSRRVQAWWDEGFDLLLTPTLAQPPPRLGELASAAAAPEVVLERVRALIPFTAPFNVTGQPAVSLPFHWSPEGLPIGVQLVAAYGREDLLVRVAVQLERAAPWIDRLPGVCAA
jgi:amidase